MIIRALLTTPIIALALSLGACDESAPTEKSAIRPTVTSALAPGKPSMPGTETDQYCGDPTLDTRTRTATTLSGDYTVDLTGLPPAVASNEIFSFGVKLSSAPDIPLDNLNIIVDAGMPHHAHGMTVRPQATLVGANGLFKVDGMLFHMPGAWDLTVDVVDGPYTERVTFHVEAR